jgi:hypothetical protein
VIALLAQASPARALTEYFRHDRRWRAANEKVEKTSETRRLLMGSTRARITSANARYMRACEARDRIERELRERFELRTQPWQLTRAEWDAQVEALRPDAAGAACRRAWHPQNVLELMFWRYYLPHRVSGDLSSPPTHRDVIAQALAEGRDVPAHVRAEYPELAEAA